MSYKQNGILESYPVVVLHGKSHVTPNDIEGFEMAKQEIVLDLEIDFDVLEMSEATAIEEMGASSTISAGSTCSKTNSEAQ